MSQLMPKGYFFSGSKLKRLLFPRGFTEKSLFFPDFRLKMNFFSGLELKKLLFFRARAKNPRKTIEKCPFSPGKYPKTSLFARKGYFFPGKVPENALFYR